MKKLVKKLVIKLIPARIKQILLHSIEQYSHLEKGYAQLTYSQQGEDLEINRLFPDLNNGLYVDVGAFHPFKYSNTYKLYKKGWRGINIEPNPDGEELFRIHRREDINLNIGVSEKKAVLKYYSFNEPAVNTFVEENAVAWSKVKGFNINEIKKIPTDSLENIFEKYVPEDKKIDLMNVDAEGMDVEVLQSNNWNKFRPRVILAEEAWYNKKSLEDSELYQFFYTRNYKLLNIVGITLFFIDTMASPAENDRPDNL